MWGSVGGPFGNFLGCTLFGAYLDSFGALLYLFGAHLGPIFIYLGPWDPFGGARWLVLAYLGARVFGHMMEKSSWKSQSARHGVLIKSQQGYLERRISSLGVIRWSAVYDSTVV